MEKIRTHLMDPNNREMIKSDGFIALTTVILVSSFIIIAGLSLALMNSDELLAGYAALEGNRASSQVDACVDNLLARLRNNVNLTGNVNIAVGNINCDGTISTSGNISTLTARATVTDAFSRNITYGVNLNVNIGTNPFTIERYKDILD